MKKLLFLIIYVLLISGVEVLAINSSELKFEKDTSGKYIYCNNPEFIYRENLADYSNEKASFLMNNENLEPFKYTLFLSHVNHTEIGDGTRWGVVSPGFDIEVDVLFTAKEDTEILISSVGFEVPENYKYYINGKTYTNEEPWGCFNAWASYLKMEISEIDSGKKYYPVPFETVKLSLKKGEKVWLGQFIPNYCAVPFYRPVHMMADFEILSGIADVNIAALKSTGTLCDRSNFYENAKFGNYVFEHQHKGISNSKNQVNAELNFIIDDKVENQTVLPVRVYNQYAPSGNDVYAWFTNLNPRSDPWSKYNVAESCMLEFEYKDPGKKRYYGKSVDESEKDDVWKFDNYHSDRTELTNGMTGYKRSNFIPNYILEPGNREEFAASLGNFGVLQNYKITIKNDGERDRFVRYNLNTASNNLIILRDENGNLIKDYPITKGYTIVKEKDTLACVKLPAKKITTFYLTVVLTTNYAGGMENSLEITDDPSPVLVYNPSYIKNVKNFNFTGREYYKFYNGNILFSKDLENWEEIKLNENVKKIFRGNESSFKILYTGKGYIAKPCIYDGITYYNVNEFYKKVYLFDEEFNLLKTKEFENYVKDISFSENYYYVEAGTKYYSDDFEKWELFDGSFDMPVSNYSGITAVLKNSDIYISNDGLNFEKIVYEDKKPLYIDSIGKYFYYTDKNTIYYSYDCLDWKSITIEEDIYSVGMINDNIIINNEIKEEEF